MGQATEEERTADRLQILMNQEVESFWESYQKSVQNDKNPQWKEKIKTIDDKIVLAVDPKSTEEERAAERMQILMNLSTETWKEWKIKYIPYYFNIFINLYFNDMLLVQK